jgi:hypothetical protein
MLSNRIWSLPLASLLGAIAVSASAAPLISNGDFSQPDTSGSWGIFNPAVSSWTNSKDTGVEIGSSPIYGLPCISSGCQNLEVNANTFGDVFQIVSGLVANKTYDLTFDYGGRPGGGPQELDVFAGPDQLGGTITGSLGTWTPYHFTFTPTGASDEIEFRSLVTSGLPSYGNEITNVTLAAVPEPTAWALMLIGVAVLGAGLRWRPERSAVGA